MDKKSPTKKIIIGEKNDYYILPNSNYIHIVKKRNSNNYLPNLNAKSFNIHELKTSSESTNTSTYDNHCITDVNLKKFIKLSKKIHEKSKSKKPNLSLGIKQEKTKKKLPHNTCIGFSKLHSKRDNRNLRTLNFNSLSSNYYNSTLNNESNNISRSLNKTNTLIKKRKVIQINVPMHGGSTNNNSFNFNLNSYGLNKLNPNKSNQKLKIKLFKQPSDQIINSINRLDDNLNECDNFNELKERDNNAHIQRNESLEKTNVSFFKGNLFEIINNRKKNNKPEKPEESLKIVKNEKTDTLRNPIKEIKKSESIESKKKNPIHNTFTFKIEDLHETMNNNPQIPNEIKDTKQENTPKIKSINNENDILNEDLLIDNENCKQGQKSRRHSCMRKKSISARRATKKGEGLANIMETYRDKARNKLSLPQSYIVHNSYILRQKRYKNNFLQKIYKTIVEPNVHLTKYKSKENIFDFEDKTNYYEQYKNDIINKEENEEEFTEELEFPKTELEIKFNIDYINQTYYHNSYILYELLMSTKTSGCELKNTFTLINNFVLKVGKNQTFIFNNSTLFLPKIEGTNKHYVINFILRKVKREIEPEDDPMDYEVCYKIRKTKKIKKSRKTKNKQKLQKFSILQSISTNIKEIAETYDIEKQFEKTKNEIENYNLLATKKMYYLPNDKTKKARRYTKQILKEIYKKEKLIKLENKLQKENLLLKKAGFLQPSKEGSKIKTIEMSIFRDKKKKKLEKYISLIKQGRTDEFIETFKDSSIINARDKTGNTLLIWAVKNTNKEIVKYLLQNGANSNEENDFGNTPLHFAFSNKKYEIVNLLIQNNANEKKKNLRGLTPWECVDNICD